MNPTGSFVLGPDRDKGSKRGAPESRWICDRETTGLGDYIATAAPGDLKLGRMFRKNLVNGSG